jgi:hypothetical protein
MRISDPTPLAVVGLALLVAVPVGTAMFYMAQWPVSLNPWNRRGLRWASAAFLGWAVGLLSYSLADGVLPDESLLQVVAVGIAIVTGLPTFLVLIPIGLYHSLTRWRLRPIQILWLLLILFALVQSVVESRVLGTSRSLWAHAPIVVYSVVTGALAGYGLVVSRLPSSNAPLDQSHSSDADDGDIRQA